MPNNYFRFKQFTIQQEKCAMKVGTDGVLLGAWTNVGQARKILDIGTGTGLIALMLAQRTRDTEIKAIEIDETSAAQANENCKNSKWNQRIRVLHTNFQQFSEHTNNQFDLIVSNPPYFIDSLKAIDQLRSQARHTDSLSFDELIGGSLKLLAPNGNLSIVLPYVESAIFIAKAANAGLYCNRRTNISSFKGSKTIRVLMEFGRAHKPLVENELEIRIHGTKNEFTEAYKNITKDFYLNF